MRRDGQPSLRQLLLLVGNPDAYSVQSKEGKWFPAKDGDNLLPLTNKVLRDHLAGNVTVGTYVTWEDKARTLIFDIDEPNEEEASLQVGLITSALEGFGLQYGVEDSGNKGYHVWVLADEYMDAAVLYRLGRGIRDEAGLPNLEVNPKQTEVRTLGNLVKLPGGVHRKTGRNNDFIGDFPEVNPVEKLEGAASFYPEVTARKRRADEGAVEYPCVRNIQDGVSEGGRNIALFHLATMLRRWSLLDEHVERIVRDANARSEPPLDEAEVLALLESSRFSGPICSQLSDDLSCGEQCIKARHPGLFVRSGALKWAADGEEVVVQVVERADEGRVVELQHPDIIQGRAFLNDPKRRRKNDA